ARRQAEGEVVEGAHLVATGDPEPSAGQLRIGEVGVAPRQPREVGARLELHVQAVGKELSSAARIGALAGEQDLPHLASLQRPFLHGLLDSWVAGEISTGPAREDADRNHVAWLHAEPTGRACVDEHLTRIARVGEPSTEELGATKRHSVAAV